MLSAFAVKERGIPKKQRGQEETFGSDGKVYGLHTDDGSWVYTYLSPNTSSCIY